MHKKVFIASILIALIGAGCVPVDSNPKPALAPAKNEPVWTEVDARVNRYDCSTTFCDVRLIIYRFNKDEFNWRFEYHATPSTIESWAKSLPQAAFVVNGVYFDEQWQPTGLLKISGRSINDKRYDLKRSGLLELVPEVRIIDTAAAKIDLSKLTEAAQSFPLLIKNGSPVSEFKDTHAARRTFIGTDESGDVYLGAVPEDTITFADLAKLLMKTDVSWDNVLNLDGGTSTGFSAHLDAFSETMNSIVQVPNVIVVEKK